MAMSAPLCGSSLFVLQRAVSENIRRTSDILLSSLYSDSPLRAPGHNRWGVAETPLSAKTQGRTLDRLLNSRLLQGGSNVSLRKVQQD